VLGSPHFIETTARPYPPTLAAPEPSFEVENLRRGAQPNLQQPLRRQQRHILAGGAIDLDEVTPPEPLVSCRRGLDRQAQRGFRPITPPGRGPGAGGFPHRGPWVP